MTLIYAIAIGVAVLMVLTVLAALLKFVAFAVLVVGIFGAVWYFSERSQA